MLARRLGAVDVDLDGGLAERGEHRKVGDALHGREHLLDLVGSVGQRLQIIAVELDRVLALHAGHRLGDVVLQILREVELDAGEAIVELLEDTDRRQRMAGAGRLKVIKKFRFDSASSGNELCPS